MYLQNISEIISHHNGSLPQALCELFPNIGLNKQQLHRFCMFLHFFMNTMLIFNISFEDITTKRTQNI